MSKKGREIFKRAISQGNKRVRIPKGLMTVEQFYPRLESKEVPGSIVYVFPGQGVLMPWWEGLVELYANSAIAKKTIQDAEQYVGTNFLDLLAKGDVEGVSQVEQVQAVVTTGSIARIKAFLNANPAFIQRGAVAVAGHSLGEIALLETEGVVDEGEGVHISAERQRFMQEVPGAMAALVGNDAYVHATELIKEVLGGDESDQLVIANDNSPSQVVVSGTKDLVERATQRAQSHGFRRALLLPIMMPSHSPLMSGAQQQFKAFLDTIPFQDPQRPFIMNGAIFTKAAEVKKNIGAALTTQVDWQGSVKTVGELAQSVIEVGKGPLAGLVSGTLRELHTFQV